MPRAQGRAPPRGAVGLPASLRPCLQCRSTTQEFRLPGSLLDHVSPLRLPRREVRMGEITDFFYIVHSF